MLSLEGPDGRVRPGVFALVGAVAVALALGNVILGGLSSIDQTTVVTVVSGGALLYYAHRRARAGRPADGE